MRPSPRGFPFRSCETGARRKAHLLCAFLKFRFAEQVVEPRDLSSSKPGRGYLRQKAPELSFGGFFVLRSNGVPQAQFVELEFIPFERELLPSSLSTEREQLR